MRYQFPSAQHPHNNKCDGPGCPTGHCDPSLTVDCPRTPFSTSDQKSPNHFRDTPSVPSEDSRSYFPTAASAESRRIPPPRRAPLRPGPALREGGPPLRSPPRRTFLKKHPHPPAITVTALRCHCQLRSFYEIVLFNSDIIFRTGAPGSQSAICSSWDDVTNICDIIYDL